jgi:HEAT repeat protein
MKYVILAATCVSLLFFAVGCDLGPKSESEKYIDNVIAATNDAADAMSRVTDAASARIAINDIRRKLMVLRNLLQELPQQIEKAKNVKVTIFKEKSLERAVDKATERFKHELERIGRLPDLPEEFITSMEDSLASFAGLGQSSGLAALDRQMMSRTLAMRRQQRAERNQHAPVPNTPPPPPETQAQREDRERQQMEAERRAKEEIERLRREQEEAMRQAEERRKEELGPDPNDPQYYEKLVERMGSSDPIKRNRAIEALLAKTPDDVPAPETRKQIAKAFKQLAELPQTVGREKEQAVRGLVIWGGKFSGPILLGLLNTANGIDQKYIIQALGEIQYAPAADAIASKLSSPICRESAAAALKEIGTEAEHAVMQVAASEQSWVCVAAVNVLGEIGTAKCLPLLNKGLSSRNTKIRQACSEAIGKVKTRIKESRKNNAKNK